MNSIVCPCVDCITLAICKGVMDRTFGFSGLSDRCSLFKDAYGPAYSYMMNTSPDIILLLKLFKPIQYINRIEMIKKETWGKIDET